MPTFLRNILSPSSGLKLQSCEVEGYTEFEGGRLRERGQSERRDIGKESGPIGSLQAG
jgi:hypothetical protein